MAEGIKTPPKFDGLNFPIWKVKMTVFLQPLGSQFAKADPLVYPLVIRTLGLILPPRNLMPIQKHTMHYFKP